jgi:hypothetical protein
MSMIKNRTQPKEEIVLKTNYLLLDYENIQPKKLPLLKDHPFNILVFVGENQTKIPLELAAALQSLGNDAEYIKISGNGTNALDFHIAFSIGVLSKENPDACFHIISKDTGFDPLIEYARTKGIGIVRSKDIADIPMLRPSRSITTQEKVDAIVKNFANRKSGKPKKEETLKSTIHAFFQKSLKESEIKALVQELITRGHISVENGKVSYK